MNNKYNAVVNNFLDRKRSEQRQFLATERFFNVDNEKTIKTTTRKHERRGALQEQSNDVCVLPRVNINDLDKESLLNILTKIQNILLPIWKMYSEIEDIDRKIQNDIDLSNSIRNTGADNSAGVFLGFIGIGVGGAFLGKAAFFKAIFGRFTEIAAIVIGFLGGCFIFSLITTLFADAKAQNVMQRNIPQLKQQKYNLQRKLKDYLSQSEFIWATKVINYKYLNYNIIKTLINYLISHRADSFKEAINLFETEQHRFRIENMQREATNATMESARYSAEIANLTSENNYELKKIRESVENIEWEIRRL